MTCHERGKNIIIEKVVKKYFSDQNIGPCLCNVTLQKEGDLNVKVALVHDHVRL
jgi:hypothetical protein